MEEYTLVFDLDLDDSRETPGSGVLSGIFRQRQSGRLQTQPTIVALPLVDYPQVMDYIQLADFVPTIQQFEGVMMPPTRNVTFSRPDHPQVVGRHVSLRRHDPADETTVMDHEHLEQVPL